MAILCLEYKAVTVQYFLDDMQNYELIPIMENLHLVVKTGWEQTRQIMFSALSPYLKKGTKLKDVLEFSWDKQHTEVNLDELTEEKRKQMFERARAVREHLNNNKGKKEQ